MFGRRRHEQQTKASAARGEAAVAFTALDQIQRQVADRVAFAAHVDGGPRGQALLERLRGNASEADAAVVEWLNVGAGDDADAAVLPDQLEQDYRFAARRLVAAHDAFELLLVEVTPELSAIEQELVAVPRRIEEAHQAMREAESAVHALRLDGLAPEAAEQALIRVHQRAEILDEGPAVHGIAEILAAADEVITIAAEARRRAEHFPHQRDDIARRLVAARTRLEHTEDKGPRLEAALSALQRSYAEVSWLDLVEAPAHFQAQLEEAHDALERAEAASRRVAYPQSLRSLERARTALTRAEEQVRLVTHRLSALDALQADPAAPLGPVQLALDDAQLLVRSDSAAAAEYGQRLGALAARLKSVPSLIDSDSPDYYGYLVELDALKAEVALVVEDFRLPKA